MDDTCFSFIHYTASFNEGLDLNKNNFFILFSFININLNTDLPDVRYLMPKEIDSFPIIMREQVKDSSIPLIGIIFLRDTIEDYKLKSLDYLTNLFIQNFIGLLGFYLRIYDFHSYSITSPYKYYINPYISKNCVPNGYTLFACTFGTEFCSFQKTKSYLMEYYNIQDNLDYDIMFFAVDIYFNYNSGANKCPFEYLQLVKERFLGEILTGTGYPEEQLLSGLALNFLDDLYYLKLVNNNFPDLMKFGKIKEFSF